ncbi:hypothetical protein G9A89_020339 [Geosiphon pyriformis]|nr:hypothetical protein G9A89_020339 [Geosiphon pyriformis]
MAYTPIMKLDKFTSKEDNAQVWLNDVEKAITANRWNDTRAIQVISYFLKNTADLWYQSLIDKLQDFNAFKLEFLRYFSNNNSINRLANTFTTIKQGETETVTTYLGCFHRNLSILQHVCPLHPATLQDAVTYAKDFESAELEANHAHTVNLVMNGSSELDSKLKQFSDSINQKLKRYLETRIVSKISHVHHHHQQHLISHDSQKRVFATTVISNSKLLLKSKSNYLSINDVVTNLSTTSISNFSLSNICNLSTTIISNLSATTSSNLSTPTTNSNTTTKLASKQTLKTENDTTKLAIGDSSPSTDLQFNYLSLLVTPEDAQPNKLEANLQLTLTCNILPVIITKDESLAAIFPFKFKETTTTLLFSRAAFEAKPITAMYTDAKIEGQSIKLILDSEAYQVSWADIDHNELLLILLWDNKEKEKEKEELIWKTNQGLWSDDSQSEPATEWS